MPAGFRMRAQQDESLCDDVAGPVICEVCLEPAIGTFVKSHRKNRKELKRTGKNWNEPERTGKNWKGPESTGKK